MSQAVPAHSTTASRRAFIGGLAALAPLAAIPALASAGREIDRLWVDYLGLQEEAVQLSMAANALPAEGRQAYEDRVYDEWDDRLWPVREAIQRCAGGMEAVCARVMIGMIVLACAHDTLEENAAAMAALEGLRPLINGPVAQTVDDHLANPDRPFCYSPLWGSWHEPGKTATEIWAACRGYEIPKSA